MTVGWIYEDTLERFLGGTQRDHAPVPLVTALDCPFCNYAAPDVRELEWHLGKSHAARRPFLMFFGREPASLDTLTRAVADADLVLCDCDHIMIGTDASGLKEVTRKELLPLIQADGARQLKVQLSNTRRSTVDAPTMEYDLRVRIAPPAALEEADRDFVRCFAEPGLHIRAIDRFLPQADGTPIEQYREGLVEYVRGVLIKDGDVQTGVSGAAGDWADAYKRSLNLLAQYERPLPRLVTALIRFALNDFSPRHLASASPMLGIAQNVLGPIASGNDPGPIQAAVAPGLRADVCPVDAGTSRVIQFAERATTLTRWSLQDQAEAKLLCSSQTLSPLDRAKMLAVWAWAARRLEAFKQAMAPLDALADDPYFGKWAKAALEDAE